MHDQSFADAGRTLKHDVFMEFITASGEDAFSFFGVVEVIEQESDHGTVVVVDYEFATLRGDYNVVGDLEEESGVHFEDSGVGHVGECEMSLGEIIIDAFDDVGEIDSGDDGGICGTTFHCVEDPAIPINIPGRP